MGVASMMYTCPGAQIKQIIVRTDVDPSPWILVQLILHMKHSHAHACKSPAYAFMCRYTMYIMDSCMHAHTYMVTQLLCFFLCIQFVIQR